MNHGEVKPTPAALNLEDRDLAMVQAPMDVYIELIDRHCKCQGTCMCEDK